MSVDYGIQDGESRTEYIHRVSEEMRQEALDISDYNALSQDFEHMAGEEYNRQDNSFWSHPAYSE